MEIIDSKKKMIRAVDDHLCEGLVFLSVKEVSESGILVWQSIENTVIALKEYKVGNTLVQNSSQSG